MIIDPLSALKFIAVYKALLREIDRNGHDARKSNLIKRLAASALKTCKRSFFDGTGFRRAEVQVRRCRS